MSATSTIPIVFGAIGDALGAGVATNLAHPDRNATGFSFLNTEISSKRMELLHEAVPQARCIAILRDRNSVGLDVKPTLQAAASSRVEAPLFEVADAAEYDEAFRVAIAAHAEAIDVLGSPIFNANREQLVRLAAHHRLPAIYEAREYVFSGGLMSYGPDLAELFRRAAGYVAKLLRGAKPSELPIEQPTKVELVINLKTAKALGLAVPQSLLQRADEVIE
jgi:putative ABC transport system substrate-binding protein